MLELEYALIRSLGLGLKDIEGMPLPDAENFLMMWKREMEERKHASEAARDGKKMVDLRSMM